MFVYGEVDAATSLEQSRASGKNISLPSLESGMPCSNDFNRDELEGP